MWTALLNDEQLQFVGSFIYLRDVMSNDSKDDLDMKKQHYKTTAVGNTVLRKLSFKIREVKLEPFRSYC